jgi:hypothetical protein
MRTTAIGQRIRDELRDVTTDVELERGIRRWLAGDDAFNVWFLETTKGKLEDQDLLALVEGYGNDQDEVERAWDAFCRSRDGAALMNTLELSLARMDALKQK